MKLWKVFKADLKSNNGNVKWELNKWNCCPDKLAMCQSGFHCSKRIIDAMEYTNCEGITRVEVKGKHLKQPDKQVWEYMRIIKVYDWKKEDSVSLAIFAAELVIKNFEKEYPDDKRPREAIEAAKKYLKGKISRSAESAGSAARSAWSAARSAESAWSAESTWSAAESAAESAWSAWSAAGSARSARLAAGSAARSAESAARSAESAARSAWLAARSAESAGSATRLAWSAESAESATRLAWSAESAESAWSAASKKILNKCEKFILKRLEIGKEGEND